MPTTLVSDLLIPHKKNRKDKTMERSLMAGLVELTECG